MALRDKTNQRFKEFFEKQSKRNDGKEFEIPFSEIQRETGAANSTMKRAIETLTKEGWLEVKPGRNSRYGLFKLLHEEAEKAEELPGAPEPTAQTCESAPDFSPVLTSDSDDGSNLSNESRIHELEHLIDGLRRRLRAHEMTIALLQDRMAEIEDKLYKK
ncbi:MAG TPA: IclR family transcriptional regulator, partial [Desulfitobacterium dehalogenans]|nr:IclR family transcriptional regulator [Desulfitobacterium dehalogenans]